MRPSLVVRNVYGLLGLISAIALGATAAWCGQKPRPRSERETPPGVFDLYRADATVFSAPRLGAAAASVGCDGSGNIYAMYAASLRSLAEGAGESVAGIFPGSKSVLRYQLPGIPDYRPLILMGLAVSPSGTVYALANTAHEESDGKLKPAWFVVKYNDDATVDSYFKVGDEPGKRLEPLRMAVFGDGDFLLSGTAVLNDGVGTFSGVFDRQGTFIAPLKLGEAVTHGAPVSASEAAGVYAKSGAAKATRENQLEAEAKNPVSLESSTLSFGSLDGNVYVLQGTSEATLYVVSPAGKIVRQYRLEAPKPGMSPVQMGEAGPGHLFIYYVRIGVFTSLKSAANPDFITVLNSETGKVAEVHRMPRYQSDFVVPACAVSPDDFLFLGASKDDHLEVVRYVSR